MYFVTEDMGYKFYDPALTFNYEQHWLQIDFLEGDDRESILASFYADGWMQWHFVGGDINKDSSVVLTKLEAPGLDVDDEDPYMWNHSIC